MAFRAPLCALSRRAVRLYSAACSIYNGRRPLRVCVVGSGPAGFYTAQRLINRVEDTLVDVIEKLPVPFGLVRFGVAPDHLEVKNCTSQFTSLARSNHCRFIGNVAVGTDVTLSQLRSHYHAVVLAYGAECNRELGIQGEDLPGVYSAKEFFGWYNGCPTYANLNPDLSGETAVVIGQGNVALDVARMLLTPTDHLKTTDICQHALEQLAESKVRRVQLVGKSGPLQVTFTIRELREMAKLPGCRALLDASDFDHCRGLIPALPRPRKRLTELMMNISGLQTDVGLKEVETREWGLSFLRTPVQLLADQASGRVCSIKLEVNKLEGEGMSAMAVGSGKYDTMDCDTVVSSIGYRTSPIDRAVPIDHEKGNIPNIGGRVMERGETGATIPGLYCSGWAKTGPVQGVALHTMPYAFETAEAIIEDYKQGNRLKAPSEHSDILETLSRIPGLEPTSFSDWEVIDAVEREAGRRAGKPREKVVTLEHMMDIIRQHR